MTMAMPSGVLGPLRMYITSIGSFCRCSSSPYIAVGVRVRYYAKSQHLLYHLYTLIG